MSSVTLDHVHKRFGTAKGVEDVHIHIESGEFFTFLGPSGCGKTTTLRMIAGFYYPSEGNIRFGSQDVTDLPPHKRNTGMVFQNYALFPHMTVFENIAFGLQVRKVSKTEAKERVERIMGLVRLEGYGERRIDQLSGGQQQRVALARALVIEPQILLLDEPLSNLDAKLREETRFEIKRLQLELGITTIYVTHDQAEAMSMSDRIMVMQGGVVQQIGTPHDIYHAPVNRFVASFIGETNLWTGTVVAVEGDEVQVRTSSGQLLCGLRKNASPLSRIAVGESVLMSIRPESIQESLVSEGENVVTGTVEMAEFTGACVNYVAQVGSEPLRSMSINLGRSIKQRGASIGMHIPKESIYFAE
ncbi:ABC transporter ATP-binding protein [Brevibacillus invocatus]|uniref:ABC transporter ATP-binding protein n=1 Tax=Brevibacillus invocatus TaxID=173959 RepID=UPI002040E19A|nr:ABC transporter ATP-binding protein [Brevibacillus invocatus]MCM3080410.1 ABC transporter ATP-binding protein [Brevibacillus invocatus]MCM3430668.1 ABC transporter ATP-binding protein [Brevibacillus invocatus]